MLLACAALLAEGQKEQRMKVKLVYFESCPNSSKAAIELEAALAELSIDAKIEMQDREKEGVAKHAQLYGSPSILVNEQDLFGEKPSQYASCRLYGRLGYPNKDAIVERLRKIGADKLVGRIPSIGDARD